MTAAILMDGKWCIGHLGDTRAYTITQESIEKLTNDHSLAAKFFELEHISAQEFEVHPLRRVLYRGVGYSDTPDIIVKEQVIDSYLLLCSRGLWENVSNEELQQMVLMGGNEVKETCDRLVKLVVERGGQEDVSILLLKATL